MKLPLVDADMIIEWTCPGCLKRHHIADFVANSWEFDMIEVETECSECGERYLLRTIDTY